MTPQGIQLRRASFMLLSSAVGVLRDGLAG
jgi:hypothetical protein